MEMISRLSILFLVLLTFFLFPCHQSLSEAVSSNARLLPHHLLTGNRWLIRQGQKAMQGEFPYQISLQTREMPGLSLCGGVIIDDRTIITAAHCVYQKHYLFKIVAGNVNLKSKSGIQERHVARHYVHPQYEKIGPVVENDIAVLSLQVPLEFNEYVQAIDLPIDDSYPSGEAIVSGWGSTTDSGEDYPDLQYFAEVPLMSAVACEAAIESEIYYGLNSNLVICSGPHTKYSYPARVGSGDSGSGLVQNGVLIGVVSWGDDTTAVYTRVSQYVNWIHQKQFKNSKTTPKINQYAKGNKDL